MSECINYSEIVEYSRHGGAYDRGSADAYYGKSPDPHYFVEGSFSSKRINKDDMTMEEINAYYAGYDEEEDRKEYI